LFYWHNAATSEKLHGYQHNYNTCQNIWFLKYNSTNDTIPVSDVLNYLSTEEKSALQLNDVFLECWMSYKATLSSTETNKLLSFYNDVFKVKPDHVDTEDNDWICEFGSGSSAIYFKVMTGAGTPYPITPPNDDKS